MKGKIDHVIILGRYERIDSHAGDRGGSGVWQHATCSCGWESEYANMVGIAISEHQRQTYQPPEPTQGSLF